VDFLCNAFLYFRNPVRSIASVGVIHLAYKWGIEYSPNWNGEYDDDENWDVIGSDEWCQLVIQLSELD
jgi:hypothetical protein